MIQYNPLQYLPTEEDLPNSDNTPVDNEFQLLIPHLLRVILCLLWANRTDWFFGINMGVYYDPQQPAIVPDGFLSLGVPRHKSNRGRLSYLIWQEQVVPQFVLEYVSQTKGGEYEDKMAKYASIGALYYVIYNPDYWRRDKHDPFEVYQLENGVYIRQFGNPVWIPEIDLGIGYESGTHHGWTRDWLYWYDQDGNRFPAPENVIEQERQRAETERQRAETERQRAETERQRAETERERAEGVQQQLADLMAKLQERGINPDDL
ncbi:Uma2 family endonuclease [Trichocoleus sp. FACHB-90]|uniref:Uma2 family endonuclease n=1 Tax=Cyanophyceae TaxID=3028117 RepID=UPI0016894EEA|nr:Uma2 family endonuclease [Trichocoleus sp. FACHB-90]MBD1926064.1 Uma2 family endonuclease [Trichocoleus sp. FACHB-90]